ncbi:IMP dehydrogenase, partial [Thioalkalivibrio denitrificans]
MAIRVALNHRTVYRFDRRVRVSPHVIRLRPAVHTRTPIVSYSLGIRPEQHFINWQQDPFGNLLARAVFPEAMRELSVTVDLVAEMTVINPFDFFVEKYAEHFPFAYDGILAKELIPYLEITESGPLLTEWLAQTSREPRGIVDFLVDLNRRLQQDIAYSVRMEPGVQTCEETLERGIGSCRDSGWLLVQILRHLGLAARFVSGYLVQLTADEKSLDGPSGPEADFTDLHAWAEVFVPGAGWIGLDPTSGLFAGEGHIPLACTPSPLSAAPITGYTEVCEVSLEHENRVRRIHEDPRVTRPYSDDQWAAIDALGHKVDQDLLDGDVRLTMGGEPTFVSIDDMEAAEWNTRADGPHKRRLARELAGRLLRRFGPGGMFHHGQGKWYPGEPLPRWSLGCFWRKDGVPVWRDPAFMADISRDYGHGRDEALALAREVAHHLGIPDRYLVPAYEDPLYYLWREGNEPVNRDPLEADLKSPAERQRLARVLSKGLDEPVGYALPISWDHELDHWRSGLWAFRRGRLFLIPGDSPMGLRLPLDSLPWKASAERDEPPPPDLFEPRPELGDYYGEVARRYSERVAPEDPRSDTGLQPQVSGDDPDDTRWTEVPHTSLCVEAREGRLHVFLPPLNFLEHYLELVSAVEAAASRLGLPVVLEGYEPPRDPRIARLLVTPDPGVIEVNIHPAANWEQLRDNTVALYEEARQSRLGTEKFMLDGRHTGTGGGNHVTLGGALPADSPLLRRPDLLGSLVTFWQHHPGLSYLFSGMFIGPTSQAPRIDEARNESLYELEIALSQLPQGEEPRPWLVGPM